MTDRWDDLTDVPDGVEVADVDRDRWRRNGRTLEWRPYGATRWGTWTDITSAPTDEYAPYTRVRQP